MRTDLFQILCEQPERPRPAEIPGARVSHLLPIRVPGDDGRKIEEARRVLERLENRDVEGWVAIARKFRCVKS